MVIDLKDLLELNVGQLVRLLEYAVLRTVLLDRIVREVYVAAVYIREAELLAGCAQIAFFEEVSTKQVCFSVGNEQGKYTDVEFTTMD